MASIKSSEAIVSATGTAATVLARNDRRCLLLIQNQGTEPVRVRFAGTATGTTGLRIGAGSTFLADSDNVPQNAVSLIRDSTATANVSVYVAEGE